MYNVLMNNCNCTPGVTVAPNYNTASSCVTPPTQLRTVTIPATQGGDGEHDPYAPQLGAYQNTIVIYKKTGSVYLYDVNGVYTNLTGTDYAATILELQEQVEAQGQQLTSLSAELSQEISTRTNADAELNAKFASLNNALAAETQNRTEADSQLQQQITAAQTQLNEFGTKLDGQAEDIATDVANLQANINQLANKEAEDVADLQTNINKNAADIAALQAGVGGDTEAFGKELVLSLGVADSSANAVTLTATMGNLGTDQTTETDINLPVASATQAGILTADGWAELAESGSSVEVVQTTGTSATSVMSQNAVTQALQGLFSYNTTTKTLTINTVG